MVRCVYGESIIKNCPVAEIVFEGRKERGVPGGGLNINDLDQFCQSCPHRLLYLESNKS
ncbi:MAG: hypothetical protein ACTSQY_10645 [Candidatus Odinarchaeia archaeon]